MGKKRIKDTGTANIRIGAKSHTSFWHYAVVKRSVDKGEDEYHLCEMYRSHNTEVCGICPASDDAITGSSKGDIEKSLMMMLNDLRIFGVWDEKEGKWIE